MSIKLYDDALLNKLRSWTLDTNLTVTGVNETSLLFSTIADRTNDKPLELPLIALRRPGGFTILDLYKQGKSYDGANIAHNNQRSALLNSIRVSIPYQLDIYTRYQSEADEYVRNIVFNIINYPNVKIELPYYNMNLKHDSSLRLLPDVEDNSDIPERLITTQFTRYTIGLLVDDAYLFDIRIKDNLNIVEAHVSTIDKFNNVNVVNDELIFKKIDK